MARLVLAPLVPRGSYPSPLPVTPASLDLVTAVAGTYTDGEGWLNTGRELLVARNTTAGALTVTITSVPYLGRSGDITTYSVPANGQSIFGPFDPKGWNQADGMVYVVGSAAGMQFGVIQLPSNIFP
jgi:hypothetical protein